LKLFFHPNGVVSNIVPRIAATPVGLMENLNRVPKVARASQPWADGHSPVGAAADTSALEREIDQQVCALYGLTPDAVKIAEEASK